MQLATGAAFAREDSALSSCVRLAYVLKVVTVTADSGHLAVVSTILVLDANAAGLRTIAWGVPQRL